MVGCNNIKYKAQFEFYHNYIGYKCTYGCFFTRIHKQGLSYEEAIQPQTLRGKGLIKTEIKENGRVCTNCLQYKSRNLFSKTKATTTGRTSDCLDCRNKKKIEYRRNNYSKDREYKKKRRTLAIGTIIGFYKEIYIDGIPREDIYKVIKYEYKKGYMIKSQLNGLYKWIDLGDNGDRPKFYII